MICKYKSEDEESSFADFNYDSLPIIPIDIKDSVYSKILFKYFRVITLKDRKRIHHSLKENNVDILHFHYGSDAGIFSPILKQINIPSIVSFYGYDAHSFPKRFFGIGARYLRKRVFKYISKVLVMSEEMKNDLLNIGCPEEKITIHYHGVPKTLSSISARSYSHKTIRLLIVSYFDPVKGHIFVLESLKKLLKNGISNFEFNIIGDGFYKKEIESKIKELGIQEYVTIHGPVKYNSPEYRKVFSEADIFVHPSVTTRNDKEGIPGAVVEAMFAGLPVISTYHGGIPYIIQNEKNGYLFSIGNSKELAEKINLALNKDHTLMQKNAKKSVEKFSWNKVIQKLERLFQP
ncbi:MAG: glycosyltransferase family 4 protein [Candidatus Aminicenantes bacterium]|nr:glycosyltransferase family 4 protein [Candidatus Aminicenantes bacterium]